MRKSIVALVAVVAINLGVVFVVRFGAQRGAVSPPPPSPVSSPMRNVVRLSVGRTTISVELAQTPEEWALGLRGRTALPEGTGMLFIFPEAAPKTFWMKDMLIPLDLFWIREGRVIGVSAQAQPESGVSDEQLRRYPSPGSVDQALEVKAGWAQTRGIRVGDAVTLQTSAEVTF